MLRLVSNSWAPRLILPPPLKYPNLQAELNSWFSRVDYVSRILIYIFTYITSKVSEILCHVDETMVNHTGKLLYSNVVIISITTKKKNQKEE
jgi:hypothetical protein